MFFEVFFSALVFSEKHEFTNTQMSGPLLRSRDLLLHNVYLGPACILKWENQVSQLEAAGSLGGYVPCSGGG
jgi:hypothetical protein